MPTLTMPFWTDDYSEDLADSDLPTTVDVAVIGAGITGLTAAKQLARAGIATAIVEGMSVGRGASGINGGMAIAGLKLAPMVLFSRFGERLGTQLWQASLDAVDLVEQIVAEEGIECSFTRCGAAELGFTGRDVRVLGEHARWTTQRLGFPIEVVTTDHIREVVDTDRFAIATADSSSASLHPARYTFGLARAALRAGASLTEHAAVTEVERNKAGFLLHTSRGRLRAGRILVATNGYTGTLFPDIRRGIVPIASYSIVTEPLPQSFAEHLIPGNRMLWTARRFLNYFRRTPDDRILFGGRRNLRPDLDLHEGATDLRRQMLEIFPQLESYEITHSWGGRLGATFDLLPHTGTNEGVSYALGYGGHGVAIATYLGTQVGGLMAGNLATSPFAEIPHPTRWYYRSKPWFLPIAAQGFRLLDLIGR